MSQAPQSSILSKLNQHIDKIETIEIVAENHGTPYNSSSSEVVLTNFCTFTVASSCVSSFWWVGVIAVPLCSRVQIKYKQKFKHR